MKRHWPIWQGTVRAEIRGGEPERFLNACTEAGLVLRNIEYTAPQTLNISLPAEDRDRMERIAALCMCETAILSPVGGSGQGRRRLRKERLLILAAVFALLLAISSLFIWDIEVVGNESLSKGEVLRALSESGITEGCFWPTTDVDAVRSRMLLREESLAWMTLNVRGSRATVAVLERREKPPIYAEDSAADLTARRGGVIGETSVKNGRALVVRGQVVAEGETLVSGRMESETGQTRLVRSEGEIIAETLHEQQIFLCPESYEKSPRHGVHLILGLQCGKNRINLGLKGRKELDGCDKIRKEYIIGIKDCFVFPLRLIVEEYRPYEMGAAYSPDPTEAEMRARLALSEEIDGEVTEIDFAYEDGVLSVQARCRENIAVHREIE